MRSVALDLVEGREHYERVSGTRADYVAANAYYYGLK